MMNATLILEFVDLAISLIQTHMDDHEAEQMLLTVVQKGAKAYKNYTGETLDQSLIVAEPRL